MDWQQERERLLADTIAFVQQTLGDSLVQTVRAKLPVTPQIETAAQQLRRYHTGPKPINLADLRAELTSLSAALIGMQQSASFAASRSAA